MHCFTPERKRFSGAPGALLGVLALLGILLPGAVRAQSAPRLVRDINATTTDSKGSTPELTVVAGKTAYFSAFDSRYGKELWKTDGTAAGTMLVKDIAPGMLSSNAGSLAAAGSTLYFQADDGLHGPELWKSDGTAAGTVMVREIMPDLFTPQIIYLTPVRGLMMFAANDGPHGIELWKSDGTAAGTSLVKDFHPIHSGHPRNFNVINDTLYFIADEPESPNYTRPALWKSDGTAAGTVRVSYTDVNTDTISAVNGRLFFSTFIYEAPNSSTRHVWLSDGTAAGKRKIASMPCFWPLNMTPTSIAAALPGGAFHFLNCDPTGATALWRSDGTTQGTRLVTTITPDAGVQGSNITEYYSTQMIVFNGALYFCARDATHGMELWKSDGTAAGTVMVKDINPGTLSSSLPQDLAIAGGKLYFTAIDGKHGRELWRTDGTAAGTVLVKDINPGSEIISAYYENPAPRDLQAVNGKVIFVASDGAHGQEVWVSDGTAAGTQMLKDLYFDSNSFFKDPAICGRRAVYFTASDGVHGRELWRSDGRTATLVKDLWPGAKDGLTPYRVYTPYPYASQNSAFPPYKICLNDAIYFGATDGTHRAGLYRCDDTTGSVVTLKDGMSDLLMMASHGGALIFAHLGLKNALEIWSSDGTPAGTKLLKQFSSSGPGIVSYFSKPAVAEFKGILYFSAQSSAFPGLWRSDGTAEGTMQIAKMTVTDPNDGTYRYNASPGLIKAAVDKLYMIAGGNLWVSYGSAEGTYPVTWKTNYVSASQLETMGGKAYYTGSYYNTGVQSDELWVSDGTEAGTRLVKDIWPGVVNSHPQELLAVNNRLFFSASDPVNGRELWVSDGTAAGTRLVKDIAPGQTGSHPQYLTPFDGHVLFNAYDPQHGNELWISDGTAEGTRLACDVTPGPLGSNPMDMVMLGDTVIFNAHNGANPAQGYEPWSWRIGRMNAVRGWTLYGE